MLIENHDGFDLLRFDSIAEQIDDVKSIMPELLKLDTKNQTNHSFTPSRIAGRARFIGRVFHHTNEAIAAAEDHWADGVSLFEKMLNELRNEELPQPVSIRRKTKWSDEDGDEIDLQRLETGKPFWRTTRRGRRVGPVTVTVLADVSTPVHVDSSDVLWRGVAALLLAELLERAGYRCEIWATSNVDGYTKIGNNNLVTATCIKHANSPIVIDSLINTVSGWYYRTVFFMSRHLMGYEIAQGYGHPESMPKKRIASIANPETSIYCQGVWDEHSAALLVRRSLEKIIESNQS